MNKSAKVAIVAALVVAVIAVVTVKRNRSEGNVSSPAAGAAAPQVPAEYRPENLTGKGVPALIDIGAETCIPCKMMAPVLEELRQEFAGKLSVHLLNVNNHPGLVGLYNVRVIPVQIFYDASGRERFRHEGFFGKEDILAKWNELGVELTPIQ
jgi:thioredoxin 1